MKRIGLAVMVVAVAGMLAARDASAQAPCTFEFVTMKLEFESITIDGRIATRVDGGWQNDQGTFFELPDLVSISSGEAGAEDTASCSFVAKEVTLNERLGDSTTLQVLP